MNKRKSDQISNQIEADFGLKPLSIWILNVIRFVHARHDRVKVEEFLIHLAFHRLMFQDWLSEKYSSSDYESRF